MELDCIAYLRLNNELVIMTESMKRQLLSKRILSNKDKATNISVLHEAGKSARVRPCRAVV